MLKVWPINFAVFVCFQLGASFNSVNAQSFIKGNIDFTQMHNISYETSLNRDFISQAVKEELEESQAGGLFSLAAILVIIILPVLIYYFRRKNKKGESSISLLSVQERRVFSMLQQGFSNKEISDELGISLSTVKTHVNNIFSKLKISSRRQVMDFKP